MEIYLFAQHMLAWSIFIAVLGFVAFPWAIVAYKIWHGRKPIDEEMQEELLIRSFYFGWALAISAVVFLFVDWLIVDQITGPTTAGVVHFVFLVGLLALSAGLMFYFFFLEDFFQGLMLAVIYLYLPTAVFFVLWWLISWNPLFSFILSWLKEPMA